MKEEKKYKSYKLNGNVYLKSKHDIKEIARMMRERIIEVSDDNVINWANVFCLEELSNDEDEE